MPTFTVILNTYNQAKYFKYVFDALEKQTFDDFEVIVTDDGSTDDPRGWIDNYNAPFRVRYFTQPHKGMRLARIQNRGIVMAEGRFIVHVMADSVPDETLLEEYEDVADEGVVCSGLRVFTKQPMYVEDIKKPDNFLEDDWRKPNLPKIGNLRRPWVVFTGNNLCVSKVDYERVKEKNGHYWNPAYEGYGLEDWELGINLWDLGCQFEPCMDALVYHIDHPKKEESPNNQRLYDEKQAEILRKYGVA